MSRFEEANNRLLEALERLERVAATQADAGSGAAGSEADRSEVENLRLALDASRRANAALRASRDAAASRLDGAIDRLKTVLGE